MAELAVVVKRNEIGDDRGGRRREPADSSKRWSKTVQHAKSMADATPFSRPQRGATAPWPVLIFRPAENRVLNWPERMVAHLSTKTGLNVELPRRCYQRRYRYSKPDISSGMKYCATLTSCSCSNGICRTPLYTPIARCCR